jgi:hypothetical protein
MSGVNGKGKGCDAKNREDRGGDEGRDVKGNVGGREKAKGPKQAKSYRWRNRNG